MAGDALLAATALRLANKTGDPDVATRARASLTALGRETRKGGDPKKSGQPSRSPGRLRPSP